MNILILQHFSDYWHEGLEKYNTSFEKELHKIIDFINNNDINKVILPLFESHQLENCHAKLYNFCQERGISVDVYEYGYAWRKEDDDEYAEDIYPDKDFNKTWCYGTRDYHTHEDVIEITEWQHALKGHNVLIGGSFYNECVSDLSAALEAINISHQLIDELIVGSEVSYTWKGLSPDDLNDSLFESMTSIIEEIEGKYEEFDVSCLDELVEKDALFVRNVEDKVNEIFLSQLELVKNYDISIFVDNDDVNDIMEFIYDNETESTTYYNASEEYIQEKKEDLHNKSNKIKRVRLR